MTVSHIISLLGGLALFLYGMQMMSSGLEDAAGHRMKRILERLTNNRFLGVAVGAGITAVIQSSSATTVMVVGFVNSGMMTLKQAVWIIMGANIGTTITGQLIALDVGVLAPLFAFVGVALVVFVKKASFRHYGQIIAGLGILFIGMEMMSSSMEPLQNEPLFLDLMTKFESPFVGILVGALFTALIQSSSASVGILQTLASSGLIALPSAVYVLFGQNIGTCITAILAAIGTTRNAKRTTVIHLLFNLIGTAVFTTICMTLPLTDFVESLTPGKPAAQIANMHTMFNVVTTLLLLPFGTLLARLATKILPDRETEEDGAMTLAFIKPVDSRAEYKIGNSAIVINGVKRELARMADMARDNVDKSFSAVLAANPQSLPDVERTEEYIDYLNKEISKYISQIIAGESNQEDASQINSFFKISGDIERIGDHAINICEYTVMMHEKGIAFSPKAAEEISQMREICAAAFGALGHLDPIDEVQYGVISSFEQRIDDMTEKFRQSQIARMRDGACSDEACILYSEMLTDFERIGDHILNIGQALRR